jgi:hypothetical protein
LNRNVGIALTTQQLSRKLFKLKWVEFHHLRNASWQTGRFSPPEQSIVYRGTCVWSKDPSHVDALHPLNQHPRSILYIGRKSQQEGFIRE